MSELLGFRKKSDGRNVLYDEFFLAAEEVRIVAFNFDGAGTALCRCDGQLQGVAAERLARVIFGVASSRLQKFLTAIFDADCLSPDLERHGEEIVWRQAELAAMSRYDRGNLAKHVAKELDEAKLEFVRYFEEI